MRSRRAGAPWRRPRGVATGVLALMVTGAWAQGPDAPRPELSLLEPGVRQSISGAQTRFEESVTAAGDDASAAAAWGRLGMTYQAHHLQGAARTCYQRAVELDPAEFRWQYYLAYLHHELGEYGPALSRYEKALKIDPGYGPARLRAGRVRLAQQDLSGARADFAAVLENEPDNPAALAGLGRVALEARRFDEAVDFLEAALRADPGADRLYYPLAMAYRHQGAAERARTALARRGGSDPALRDPVLAEMARLARSAQIYLEQGYAASRAGRMAEAVAAFRMAVEFNPDDVAARVSLGQGLALSGDHGGAMEQFDRALALDPRHPVAHYWRGTLMEEDGDDAGAAVEFAAALEADPGHVRAGMRLGDALMRLGRYEQAAGAYAGIDLNGGGQALVRYWQGLALFGGGACEQAVPVLEAAFELKPDSGEIYQALARGYAVCTASDDPRRRQAVELATQLFEARPDEAHAETLAMAWAAAGDPARAAEMQERLVESSRRREDPVTGWRERQLEHYRAGQGADEPWPPGHPVYYPERSGAGSQAAADR